MSGYDAWLERPYQRAAEEGEAFLNWCEENELDPEAPGSFDAFTEVMAEEANERLIDQYEAYLERIQDERDEEWE